MPAPLAVILADAHIAPFRGFAILAGLRLLLWGRELARRDVRYLRSATDACRALSASTAILATSPRMRVTW